MHCRWPIPRELWHVGFASILLNYPPSQESFYLVGGLINCPIPVSRSRHVTLDVAALLLVLLLSSKPKRAASVAAPKKIKLTGRRTLYVLSTNERTNERPATGLACEARALSSFDCADRLPSLYASQYTCIIRTTMLKTHNASVEHLWEIRILLQTWKIHEQQRLHAEWRQSSL